MNCLYHPEVEMIEKEVMFVDYGDPDAPAYWKPIIEYKPAMVCPKCEEEHSLLCDHGMMAVEIGSINLCGCDGCNAYRAVEKRNWQIMSEVEVNYV